MLTARVLPPAEWKRLKDTESAPFMSATPGSSCTPVVVEEDGEIVATWTLTTYVVVEGLWIHERHRRRVGAARALLRAMRRVADAVGARVAVTFSQNVEVDRMLGTFGAEPLPATPYLIPLRRSACQQQQ